MHGDVRMLHRCAPSSGNNVLLEHPIPEDLASQNPRAFISAASWSDVPTLIHRRAKEQRIQRVTALCSTGSDRLTMEDVCVEGLDFHWSRVMQELIAHRRIFGKCFQARQKRVVALISKTF